MNLFKGLLAGGLLLLLAGCNDNSPSQGETAASFTARVQAVVTTPGNTDLATPQDVTTVVAATSETAQPVSVTFE